MSPEVCQNKPYSYQSDIWALGCILYELCALKHAFHSENLLGLVYKIVQEEPEPLPEPFSGDMQELVNIAWALATVGESGTSVFATLARESERRVCHCNL